MNTTLVNPDNRKDLLHIGYTLENPATHFQMVHSYTIQIKLRKESPRGDGSIPVILQAVLNRIPVPITLGVECNLQEFDETAGRVRYSKKKDPTGELTSAANFTLDQARVRAQQIFNKYRYLDRNLDRQTFKAEFKNGINNRDFYAFVETKVIRELAGKNSPSTLDIYRETLNWLKKYKSACRFSELSPVFVEGFDRYMAKAGLVQNTRMKYHKNFKFFCNQATLHKMLFEDIYEHFQIKRIKGNRTYLDIEEMKKLLRLYNDHRLPVHLENTLKNFIFSMFTGIRISDLKALQHFNIVNDTLVFRPVKTLYTNNIVTVPLSNIALRFMQKNILGAVFNVPSDPITNRYLKIIALVAEIPKHITTHVARHTFATNYIELDGNIVALQKILGHAKIETTMEYVHVSEKKKRMGVANFDKEFGEFL